MRMLSIRARMPRGVGGDRSLTPIVDPVDPVDRSTSVHDDIVCIPPSVDTAYNHTGVDSDVVPRGDSVSGYVDASTVDDNVVNDIVNENVFNDNVVDDAVARLLATIDDMPLLDRVSLPTEPDTHVEDEDLFEVHDLVDYRVARVAVPGGGTELQEQFLVEWANHGPENNSWESRRALAGAPDFLATYEDRYADYIRGKQLSSGFRVDDLDCSLDSRDSFVDAALLSGEDEKHSSSLHTHDHHTHSETVSDVHGLSTDSRSHPHRRREEWVTADGLSAQLASIAIVSDAGGRPDVESSGEVRVPVVNPLLQEKLLVAREVHERALDPETVAKLKDRIDILALAASSPSPQSRFKLPRSYREAIVDHNWKSWLAAMEREMQNMHDFGVWELVPMPKDKNLMSCRWVFAVKRDVDGRAEKLKARLTCRGFTQRAGVDFDDTWAPTCRMRVFRMMMAEASSDPLIRTAQWDCTAAFLHADVL